jgi:YHS domain-containing protein
MFSLPPQPFFTSCRPASLSGGFAGLVVAALAGTAAAEIAWHADLDTARAAASASGRPVLALVIAAWDESPVAHIFASSEVDAVVSACFEPVWIDVGPAPEMAGQLGIERVPSVAVLGAASEVLTRFECPATAAEFVAAAARAAQLAAATSTASQDPSAGAARDRDLFGTATIDDGEQPAANMTAKVRQLSSFAEGRQTPARDPHRFPASVPAIEHQPAQTAVTNAQFSDDPALPASPPAWPAERSVASAFDPIEPARSPAGPIEPAATAASPWLAGGGQPQPDAGPAATVSDLDSSAAAADSKEATQPSNWFVDAVQRPFNWLTGRSSKPAVEPPPKMPAARPQSPAAIVAAAAAAAPPMADPHGSMPLGLEGYCPVTIADRGMWVEGRAQWGVRHRGRTYLFAGPEQQQAFLTTPDRYAPALSGDDPVLAFDSGTAEPGRRAYGVTYQSRMYLFASPETRAAFAADPARYTARVQLAEGLPAPEAPRRF